MDIKTRLSKNNLAIKKNSLYKSLAVPTNSDLVGINIFAAGKNLPSNPFFPKHLYQTKDKKKK